MGTPPVLLRGTAMTDDAPKATVARAASDLKKCMVGLKECGGKECEDMCKGIGFGS